MSRGRARSVVLAAWAVLAACAWAWASPRTSEPGLYYDEAFFAQQAQDFFEPERGLHHPASTRQILVAGRPFPLRNAVYLGSTKSQLLIPVFAIFGADAHTLRLGTLAVALAALLAWMLWAERVLGAPAAVLGGALAAADPAFVFLSVREWGPFTALLLLRGLALLALTAAWTRRSAAWAAAGGLALGLGVTTRADFAVTVAAALTALVALRPGLVREALGSRRRLLAAALAAALVGAAPMLVSAGDLLRTSASPALGSRGDLAEKLRVLGSLLDGSHFERLMRDGGRFDRMFARDAPAGAFGVVLVAAAAVVALGARADRRRGAPLGGDVWCLAAGVLVTAGTLAVPGAVRAHHLLNGFPLLHLAVAAGAVRAWSGVPGRRRALAARAAVTLALALVLAGDLAAVARTRALIEASGGRGWWSDATREVARELEADPKARGISLDWGLHEPLLFQTRRARLEEVFWSLGEPRRGAPWSFRGGPRDLYLLHDRPWDLFGYGPRFLVAARRLAAREPGAVEIRPHADREGEVVFWSVRFARPHEITWRGAFRIRLDPADPGAAPGAPPPPPRSGDSPSR